MSDQATPTIIEDNHWWIVETPTEHSSWLMTELAGLTVLLAGLVLVYYFYRKKKLTIPFFAPPTAAEIALKALQDLEPELAEDRCKEGVIQVSQILRTYIQSRFRLRALHRSTEEFLRETRQAEQLSEVHQSLLGDFLLQCDLVKFARKGMALPEMVLLLQTARSFVEGTPEPRATAPTGTRVKKVKAPKAVAKGKKR